MDIEKKEEQPLRSTPTTTGHHTKPQRRRRCIIICSSILAVLLSITIIIIILAFTVFKAKKPVLAVTSVALQDFDVSVVPIPPSVTLNVSLALGISIKNPNKVSIKYRNSSATLRYKGRDIGDVPIPAGKLGSDDTERLNLTVTIFADRVVMDPQIYSDIIGGVLPISTYAKIKAKVRVVVFNIHVTSTSSCDINIDVRTRSIANETCRYKNKL
ncbi:uncharacterized protein LOC143578442 [Bidens hawaiensis]|uniref:uncharacterized protein LOC143578442 n=1 Tax=Bidens hawaiensis TaxID=980011 RepID=UPI00404B733C